ncbi:MAG: PD-(D/E)XK nuclease family protein [Flavobacteriaceae bacterium]
MDTFIEGVLSAIKKEGEINPNMVFILPSKRSVAFLKKTIAKQSTTPFFAPKIISIEAFIEEISNLKIVDSLTVLLSSYSVYLNTKEFVEKDSFEEYTSWAQAILNDFNEIDRHLVPKTSFFSYLKSIQTLEKWGVKNDPTPFIQKYLSFWENLYAFYDHLNSFFLKEQKGYQGMVYRKAAEDMEHYIAVHGAKKHYFIGFNALNKAEQIIIQEVLETGNGTVFWDIEDHQLQDSYHAASHFIRKYKANWNYYKKNPIDSIKNHCASQEITITETQNDIGQVKYVGQLLSSYTEEELTKTAVVLSDESLLIPLLYSLPNNIKNTNITMGMALKNFSEIEFFDCILDFQIHPFPYYYKKIERLLLHPFSTFLGIQTEVILEHIKTYNISNITYQKIIEIAPRENKEVFDLIFGKTYENITVEEIVKNLLAIIKKIEHSGKLEFTQRYVIKKVALLLQKIELLRNTFQYINTPSSLKSIFSQLVAMEAIDFEGNPNEGLQIMGLLETRVLDFENIIVLSVNEGVLPSGKSNSSFITYDLKVQFGLPLHTEKDAVYAYHFFHLLFRAKKGTFIYSTQSKGLSSGEKSRFLLQLEVEKNAKYKITHEFQSSLHFGYSKTLQKIEKTDDVINRLKQWASGGISPSALLMYIRNPIGFYTEKILGVREIDSLEETIAYNTLGTIVHESLENLYRPLIGKALTIKDLTLIKNNLEKEVIQQFKNHFKLGDFSTGKNLIIFEIAKRYVGNLIELDCKHLSLGNTIEILALEEKIEFPLSFSNFNFPIILKGTIDRIDRCNDTLRIIDYKTGKVEQKELDLIDWEVITKEYDYSKAFQVLTYAYLYHSIKPIDNIIAGVISFKNLSSGFMTFRKKEAPRSTSPQELIGKDTMLFYESELKTLLLEILNPSIPFTQKEI